jgi:hypothetical protein
MLSMSSFGPIPISPATVASHCRSRVFGRPRDILCRLGDLRRAGAAPASPRRRSGRRGTRRDSLLSSEKADEKCLGRLRVLMTHLCHKPVGGRGRDSAVQQAVCRPVLVLSFWSSTQEGTNDVPSQEESHGHRTARVHHASRRRGGVAARGARAAGRPRAAHRPAPGGRRERSRGEV